jgi:hypothetical protein
MPEDKEVEKLFTLAADGKPFATAGLEDTLTSISHLEGIAVDRDELEAAEVNHGCSGAGWIALRVQ